MCNTYTYITSVYRYGIPIRYTEIYKSSMSSNNAIEGFNSQENEKKARRIWQNRDLFSDGSTYSNAKKHIKWIDPVIYDEVYKESIKGKLNETFLMNMIY